MSQLFCLIALLRYSGTLDIPKHHEVQQGSHMGAPDSTQATPGSAPAAHTHPDSVKGHAGHLEGPSEHRDGGQTSHHRTKQSARSEIPKANTGTVTGPARTGRHQKPKQPQVKASNAQRLHDPNKKPSVQHIENVGAAAVARDVQRGWTGYQTPPVQEQEEDHTHAGKLAKQIKNVLGLNIIPTTKAYDTRGKPSIPDGQFPEDSFGS